MVELKSSGQPRHPQQVPPMDPNTIVIFLSSPVFALSWFCIMMLHAICAVYYVFVIKLHLFLKTRYYISYLGPTYMHYFDVVIVASGILSGIHTIVFVGTILSSLWCRELTFKSFPFMTSSSKKSSESILRRRARGVFYACFGRRGFFGIEYPHFPQVFVLREIVENVFQTYQAYQLSSLVSSIWINRVYAFVIVANCWSSPIVNQLSTWRQRHRITRALTAAESLAADIASESFRRICCLGFDMLLDGFASIVIPVVIMYSYVRDFQPDLYGIGEFPFVLYYDDTYFIKAIVENQQIFVRSWFDFVSKALPGLGLLSGLRTIKKTLRKCSNKAVKPIDGIKEVNISTPHENQGYRMRFLHLVSDTFLFLWGLCVLGLHIYATRVAVLNKIPGCLLEIRPWFSSQYNCVTMEINCDRILHTHLNPTTSIIDMDTVLGPLATWSVRQVIISSCPQLVMPSRITTFNKLYLLKIYNSTIFEWGAAAAIQGTKHPEIQFLYIVETNMTMIPEGLLSHDFPGWLQDIEFCGTNLTSLPTNLYEIWGVVDEGHQMPSFMQYFVFENIYGGLPEVPAAIANPNGFHFNHISLCATGLTSIPEHFFWANSSIQNLDMSSNPVASLPDRELHSPMWQLHLEFCDSLKELPQWVHDVRKAENDKVLTLFLGGTPSCPPIDTNSPTPPSMIVDGDPLVHIDCSLVPGSTIRLLFPLEYERQQRKTSRKLHG